MTRILRSTLGRRRGSEGLLDGRPRRSRVSTTSATDAVVRGVVHAAAAEHETVDADSHVGALRFYALPHEHASALDLKLATRHTTRLWTYFVPCGRRSFLNNL